MKKCLLFAPAFCAAAVMQAENLIPGDSSFETGYGVWNRSGEIRKTDAPDGSCALHLTKGIRSGMLFNLKPGQPHVFSVYLKSEKPDARVMLQAYRRNWDGRNITKYFKVSTEWTRYELPIPAQKFGDFNKFELVIASQGGAAVFADAVQLETAENASEYLSAEPLPFVCEIKSPVLQHIFLEGEDPEISFRVFNARKEKAEASIGIKVTDYYGKNVLDSMEKLTFEPGRTFEKNFRIFSPEKKGFYTVEYTLTGADGKKQVKKNSFCVLAHPLKRPEGTRALFGLVGIDHSNAEPAARLGVQSTEFAYRWSYLRENGELGNTEWADRTVEALNRKGIEVNIYLRRTPPFAAMKKSPTDVFPPKDEYVASFEDFAYRVASRYKGKVHSYQMWGGEADGLANLVSKELGKDRAWFIGRLAELNNYGYKGVKRGDPDALVDTPAVCGTDCAYSRFTFQSAVLKKIEGHYDRVVIHPYCYPWTFKGDRYVQTPEEADLVNKYHTISKIANGKRVVNGEYGFAISSGEPFDSPASRRRAAYMARSFLLTALCPEVDYIMYYTFNESELFGLFDRSDPYPDAAAYSALARQLCGATDPEELATGALLKGCSFTVPDGAVAALWIPSNREIEFETAENTPGVRAFDIMGNELPMQGKVRLSGAPVYFRCAKGQKALNEYLLKGKLRIDPLALEIRAHDDKTLVVHAANQLPKELSGTLTLRVPVKGGEVKEITQEFSRLRTNGVTENLKIELPQGIDFAALNAGKEIEADVKTDEGSMKYAQKMEVLPCPKVTFKPEIDGDLSKWEKIPCFDLNTIDYLFPPDAFAHETWRNAADLSIKARIAWDDSNFYFAARVLDDTFVSSGDAEKIWNGDCIQMAFDTLNDARGPGYQKDEVEFGLGYSDKEKRTVVCQTWPAPMNFPKSVRAAVKPGDGFIDYEVAIPFSLLRPLQPREGSIFGYNFTALDRDLNVIECWMGLTYGICGGKNPSVFKKFILTKGEEK